jgi:acetyl esterase
MPLDPKVQALLARMKAHPSPPIQNLSPAEHRAVTVTQARATAPPPPVAAVVERTIPGPAGDLPVTLYTPAGRGPLPLLLYFHGGGFMLPSLPHHDSLCRSLCNGVGCVVVAVHYRLAPEFKFPAAPDDCLAATRWAAQHALEIGGDSRRIAVAGDSSGGALAAVTALRCRDKGGPLLQAQVLLCPLTAYHTPATPSSLAYAEGYMMTRERLIWYLDHYLNDASEAEHPSAFPLAALDLHGLPPALIITAEYDVVRDEGERYAERLQAAGVPAVQVRYPGMIHGFFSMVGVLDQAQQAIDQTSGWLKEQFTMA